MSLIENENEVWMTL